MHKRKKWLVKVKDPILQFILSRQLGVSPLMAQLLINRGIYTVGAAREFLDLSMQRLYAPTLMRDMSRAVEETVNALSGGKRILVYGDYDVDGVTGTALLVHVLRRLGGAVEYYIPNRISEGYGLHAHVLQQARENGIDLVITVDCGISAADAVEISNNQGGPQIIITDHHEPPPVLPCAAAVLNPKRRDCHYPYKDLAGVGVAFKFVQALLEKTGASFGWQEYLDFVCLGTIADIVPLNGENRILVKHGLPVLADSPRPGLQALQQVSGLKEGALSARDVGYILGPRLNAAGRLGDARLALELLLTTDHDAAREMAENLNNENQDRQRLEAAVLSEAMGMLDGDPALAAGDVLVLASRNWHSGVIGIVASRLVERFYKPTLLIACDDEGDGKGSARSIKGFHLYNALEHCADYLDGYGGHAMAAGFSIQKDKIDLFRDKINKYAAAHLSEQDKIPVQELDALISLQEINLQLIDELEQLAPYGAGNPEPAFGLEQVQLINCRGVGRNNAHLKMLLRDHQVFMDGIGFNLGNYADELAAGKETSLSFVPEINTWQGRKSLQIKVKDVQLDLVHNRASSFIESDSNLRNADDLIFIPETLLVMLRDFLASRRHPLPNEMRLLKNTLQRRLPEPPAKCPPPVDVPGEQWLANLDVSLGNILLLTNCACHTMQLSRYIKEHNPHFTGTLACLHGFMSSDRVSGEIDKISQQDNRLVIATVACLAEESLRNGLFDRLLLVSPPSAELEWRLINELEVARAAGVKAIYPARDWDENRKHLEELAPEREKLAHFYIIMRSVAANGTGALSRTQAMERMEQAGHNMVTSISLIVASAVFADLGLLQYCWEGDMLKYKMFPPKGKKMELLTSPTYNWVHKIKSDGLNWINASVKLSGA